MTSNERNFLFALSDCIEAVPANPMAWEELKRQLREARAACNAEAYWTRDSSGGIVATAPVAAASTGKPAEADQRSERRVPRYAPLVTSPGFDVPGRTSLQELREALEAPYPTTAAGRASTAVYDDPLGR